MLGSFKDRVKERMHADERINIFALAGVLALLLPRGKPKLQEALGTQRRHLARLQEEAIQYTFIPSFFALVGMSLVSGTKANFSLANCERLLSAAEEYAEKGPAIELVRAAVRSYLPRG